MCFRRVLTDTKPRLSKDRIDLKTLLLDTTLDPEVNCSGILRLVWYTETAVQMR